jgi:ribosomal protein L31E
LHCFKYIKDEIRKNVKSIIERITTADNILIDEDLEEEIISEENDKPENLLKQRLFDTQAENRFKKALEMFLQN